MPIPSVLQSAPCLPYATCYWNVDTHGTYSIRYEYDYDSYRSLAVLVCDQCYY